MIISPAAFSCLLVPGIREVVKIRTAMREVEMIVVAMDKTGTTTCKSTGRYEDASSSEKEIPNQMIPETVVSRNR